MNQLCYARACVIEFISHSSPCPTAIIKIRLSIYSIAINHTIASIAALSRSSRALCYLRENELEKVGTRLSIQEAKGKINLQIMSNAFIVCDENIVGPSVKSNHNKE
jgi:hypothetical protein